MHISLLIISVSVGIVIVVVVVNLMLIIYTVIIFFTLRAEQQPTNVIPVVIWVAASSVRVILPAISRCTTPCRRVIDLTGGFRFLNSEAAYSLH
jgi:hypothetical protein